MIQYPNLLFVKQVWCIWCRYPFRIKFFWNSVVKALSHKIRKSWVESGGFAIAEQRTGRTRVRRNWADSSTTAGFIIFILQSPPMLHPDYRQEVEMPRIRFPHRSDPIIQRDSHKDLELNSSDARSRPTICLNRRKALPFFRHPFVADPSSAADA